MITALPRTENELIQAFRQHYQENMAPEVRDCLKRLADAKARQADAKALQVEARTVKEECKAERAEIAREKLVVLTQVFYSIFHGKTPLPEDKVKGVFDTYIADGSLTVGETADGKSFAKVNSMKAVTHYLADNKDVKMCDFRPFGVQISDIPTLSEFLKTATIKAVAFNKDIPADSKAKLQDAVAARNGTLKVQYF